MAVFYYYKPLAKNVVSLIPKHLMSYVTPLTLIGDVLLKIHQKPDRHSSFIVGAITILNVINVIYYSNCYLF